MQTGTGEYMSIIDGPHNLLHGIGDLVEEVAGMFCNRTFWSVIVISCVSEVWLWQLYLAGFHYRIFFCSLNFDKRKKPDSKTLLAT